MLNFLPAPLRGLIAMLLFSTNTLVFFTVMFPFILSKALIPVPGIRYYLTRIIMFLGTSWIDVNSLIQKINYGIGGGAAFLCLSLFGFDPKLPENTDLANFGLICTFTILPALLYILCGLFIWFFPIDAGKQEIIRRRIETRARRSRQKSQ